MREQTKQESPTGLQPKNNLGYPLRAKALREAFQTLNPEGIRIHKPAHGHSEAMIDGEWSLHKLTKHLLGLGFKVAGPRANLAFVNEDATVGCVLQGVKPHPTKNAWSTFCLEIDARSQRAKQTDKGSTAHTYLLGL